MNLSKYLTPLLIAPALTLAQPILAQKKEPDLSKKLTMHAKPAVVRIISQCRGTYTLYNKPLEELHPDDKQAHAIDTIDIDLSFFGTGFLINPDGYIVTSSRVAQSQKDCHQSLARNIKTNIEENKYYYNNRGLTDEELAKITENSIIENKYNQGEFQSNFGEEGGWHVHFSMPQSNPLLNVNRRPIEVLYSGRKEGQTIKIHRDIAIIKVSMENAPTLKIANSNEIRDQDTVVVVGYPNAADFTLGRNIALTQKSYLESSVQEGKISNRNKEIEGGHPVLQVDIRVGEGNAGSPLINKKGEVVGMLVFNDSDEDSRDDNGRDVPLALPTSTLRRFIQQANATNIPGEVDLLYDEGLQKFWRGKYKEAKADFLQVKNLYPFHSEVDKLIGEIDQIEAERWAKPWTNPTYIFSVGLILAAGVVGGIAYFLLKQKTNFAHAGTSQYRGSGVTGGNPVYTSPVGGNGKGTKCFIEMEYKGQIERFQLSQEEHRLGRDPSWADLTLPPSWELISRHHAVFKQEGDDYYVFDGDGKTPSRNGLWVSEDYPVDTKGHLLENGDKLKIGQDINEQIVLTYYNPNSEQAYPKTTMAR